MMLQKCPLQIHLIMLQLENFVRILSAFFTMNVIFNYIIALGFNFDHRQIATYVHDICLVLTSALSGNLRFTEKCIAQQLIVHRTFKVHSA